MKKLIFKWPLAIIIVFALALGTFAYVGAMEKISGGKHNLSSNAKDRAATQIRWYELIPTDDDSPSNQQLASGTPMPQAPAEVDEEGCARNFNEGDYCAVAVEFDATATDFTLTGQNLQVAINNHAEALGIASNNPAVDEDEDGYSRKQPE